MKLSNWLFLLLAVTIVYFPILGNDFLYNWDDQWVVMNRYTESGFNFSNLWAILTDFYHGQYAPFNELLYLILHSFFGYNPFYFHLASLLIHAISTLLVYVCFERFLLLNTKIRTAQPSTIAFLTALLFAVHPFNVESVAWMSASKILVAVLALNLRHALNDYGVRDNKLHVEVLAQSNGSDGGGGSTDGGGQTFIQDLD